MKRGETYFLDAVNQEKADNRFPRKSTSPLHYKHIKGTIWNSYIQKLLKIGQLPESSLRAFGVHAKWATLSLFLHDWNLLD